MKNPQRITALTSSVIAAALFFSTAPFASAATDTWTGTTDFNWASPGNWTGGNAPPVAGDALFFNGAANSSPLNNNLTAGTAIDGLYFTGGPYTFNGNSVLLSGAFTNNVGVLNTSGSTQTFGTMPLILDWGAYTFSSPSGTLALNSSLTLNTGSVAIFDANNSSLSLGNDSSGLISGLGGAGLTFNVGNTAFTGLAAMSGTSIATYSGWPSVVPSASTIGATTAVGAQNIELTATTTGGYTLAGGTGTTYINTVLLNSATASVLTVGSAAGIQTIDVGAVSGIGGFYVVPSGTAPVLTVGSGSSTILTAGPETGPATPGTIVFAVNGPGAATNSAEVNCVIKDNSSGGAVSFIKAGTGNMFFNGSLSPFSNNTFSGGIYVDQGQLQIGNVGSTGTGSIYVASNATLYFNNAGTVTNTLSLSPGTGSPISVSVEGIGTAGALAIGSATAYVFSGPMNLLGSPVTAAPGCRLGSVSTPTITISGQITGTGTFDYYSAHSGTLTLNNPNTSGPNANNWTGGIILDGPNGHAVNEVVKMGGNNQMGGGNVIIAAPFVATPSGATKFDLFGTSQTIGALIGTGTLQGSNQVANGAASTAATLTMGGNNVSGVFSGATSDSAAAPLNFIKVGTGTQTFDNSAANGASGLFLYHGNTTVNNGTLALTGSTAIPNTPVITVAAPATFDASAVGGLTLSSSQTLNCVGTVLGNLTVNGTVASLDSIGTFTLGSASSSANMTLNPGGTNIWDINDTAGTNGVDPGWSFLNVTNGSLTVGSTDGSPFTINIVSLTHSDSAGSASNFISVANYSFPIAYASGGINNFSDSGQFKVLTSSFANDPTSASQWSVTRNGNYLMLNYNGFQTLTTSLPVTPLVVDQGHTATFTVTANSLGTSPSFTWFQNGNQLSNGGTSAGGNPGNVSIVPSGGGYTSTLMISGVDSAGAGLDGGIISVTATETYQSNPQMASSSETLNVIDAPYNPNVAQTGASSNPSLGGYGAGGRTYLSATVSGGINNVTPDFTYQWYLGTNAVSGGTNAVLDVNIAAATAGNYTVVIVNPAGSVTNSPLSISPVSSVPGQIINEPFDSYTQIMVGFVQGSAPDTFSSSQGITNLFNQLTGEPSYWTVEGSTLNTEIRVNGLAGAPGSTGENQFGGEYPWPGLAGDSPNEMYWTTTTVNNHLRITTNGSSLFAVGGPNTNIYFSFSMSIVSLGSGGSDGDQGVFAGFCTGAGASACNLEFWTQIISGGASSMLVGVGKGNGTTVNNPTEGVNINPPNVVWGANNTSPLGNDVWTQQSILVIGRYSVVDGPGGSNDTVTLWIDPPASSYNAATPPTPYLGPTSFGGTIANSVPQDFVLLNDYAPASHRVTDLRIGTTWASVTPPAAPTFILGNVYAPLGTTAVFASQNAGNPVTGGYGWQFNGGSPLSDGATGHGSFISGSLTGTLTISNVQAMDYGLYTVNGTNTDVSPNNSGALTGSTSAILSAEPPSLHVVYSAPDVVVLWPTNWIGYVLEQTPSVKPTSWTTNSLPPYAVMGTNNAVTVPASSTEFYRLINP